MGRSQSPSVGLLVPRDSIPPGPMVVVEGAVAALRPGSYGSQPSPRRQWIEAERNGRER
ncbi:MAG: hypothetical protein M1519_03855 [Actinobacteria bacterium]|nr:hypothetical protein [Actinomycetota bacterium]